MFRPRKFRPMQFNELMRRDEPITTHLSRIDRNMRLGLPNVIVIDGQAQTGKSTLARSIALKYDKNFKLAFTTEDILNYLKECANEYYNGNFKNILGKWIFFDEPQLDVPRMEFWSARNRIIQAVTSSFGFLKNNLIMALPNIKGLSDIVITNITMRVTVRCFELSDHTPIRKAYFKKVIWSEFKNKWYWKTYENHTIPYIIPDVNYDLNKADNFFKTQLTKWRTDMRLERKTYYNIDKKTGNIIISA